MGLISIMILTSVYYLNVPETDRPETGNNYLKSEICYYALQGIESDYHYHLQLNITVNGERIVIPANVGFEKNENNETLFLHPIHTYDNSGRIHVETMKNASAELGFFFDIWGVDFSEKGILGNDVDDQYAIEMTVNNQIVNTFERTLLEPYIFIEIDYKSKN